MTGDEIAEALRAHHAGARHFAAIKARRDARRRAGQALADQIAAAGHAAGERVPVMRASRYPAGRGWIRRDTLNAIRPMSDW